MTEVGLASASTLGSAVISAALPSRDRTAVVVGEVEITYEGMLRGTLSLVRALLREGVAEGDRVALLCPRGPEGLCAALAIMLIGGIYVPVSPEYPRARMDHIVVDSGCCLAIIDSSLMSRYRPDCPPLVLQAALADSSQPASETHDELSASCRGSKETIAYILYSSGSTGRPKGVATPHSALMNTLAWMARAFEVSERDSVPQKTAWGFTDSLWEMFLPLLVGAKIAFATEDDVRDPIQLYAILERSGATMTQFVPSALSAFLDAIRTDVPSPGLRSLRWLVSGGEELPRVLVDRWFDLFPHTRCANAYGMTESALYATWYVMSGSPPWGMRRIPIGKPIDGASVFVLDDDDQELGPDQVGEICVSGRSLMAGYWNQPRLTAEVLNRVPSKEGLVYHTGDYGYLRSDGEMAYMGRRDRQVKVRGMRVELGEIESAIMQHQSVRESAVVVDGDGENRRLLAFYTCRDTDVEEDDLKSYLNEMLPRHMVPTRCIMLTVLPTTAHGKVDRAELAGLEPPPAKQRASDLDGADSTENELRDIWSRILGRSDLSLDDKFFEVGGNSLLVVRVYTKLPPDYREALTVSDLLRYPTIRLLAQRIRNGREKRRTPA